MVPGHSLGKDDHDDGYDQRCLFDRGHPMSPILSDEQGSRSLVCFGPI